MASMCPSILISPTSVSAPQPAASHGFRCSFGFTPMSVRCRGRNEAQVIRMAPDEQWRVRCYPDTPDWMRPNPPWRRDNFPEFPPFTTPPPIPIAYDPLGEEELEEEERRMEEEEWQQPEQEEAPGNRSWMTSNKRYY